MKVLISPGFGAGWSTWQYGEKDERMFMLTYQPFIDYLEKHSTSDGIPTELVEQFRKDWVAKFPNADTPYEGGLRDLCVAEVTGAFVVHEYDGFESIQRRDELDWIEGDEISDCR